MPFKLNLQNKENDYFEIFGPPDEGEDCFLRKRWKNHELGNTGNFFQQLFDLFEFLLMKIAPRFVLAIITILLLSDLLSTKGQYLFYLILQVSIFIFFPPSIETLYLLEQHENDNNTLKKLLYLSKDESNGICVYNKSFVLKDICKSGLKRKAKDLSRYIDFKTYEMIYHKKMKREYKNEYRDLELKETG